MGVDLEHHRALMPSSRWKNKGAHMAAYYTLHIAGLTRELKICSISDKLDIAAFILFSDVELTEACAKELAARVPACDYILTAESKGIPLAYEMSRQLGVPYIVARKSVKGYMTDVLSVQVKSITTAAVQTLYLDGDKAAWMRGKRILVVDDVVSTGDSLRALHQLVQSAGGTVAGNAAPLAEGDAASRDDLIYLRIGGAYETENGVDRDSMAAGTLPRSVLPAFRRDVSASGSLDAAGSIPSISADSCKGGALRRRCDGTGSGGSFALYGTGLSAGDGV